MFHIDPVLVLQAESSYVWAVRVAAHNVIVEEERKAAAAAKAKGR